MGLKIASSKSFCRYKHINHKEESKDLQIIYSLQSSSTNGFIQYTFALLYW